MTSPATASVGPAGDSTRSESSGVLQAAPAPAALALTPALAAALVAAAAALAFRFWYASFRPLLPDEAYYWVWTRHLAAGYFDHPPMVAYLIAASTRLFGQTELGVRALGAVLMAATVGVVLLTARDVGVNRPGRLLLLAIWLTSPLLAGLATMMSPDTPAAFFATATLAVAVRIARRIEQGRPARWLWPAMGALGGLALTSKYTAALTGAAVAGAFLTHRAARRRLTTPGPWLALAVAALVFAPVVTWNARHGWASFGFQLTHGLSGLEQAGADAGAAAAARPARGHHAVAEFLLFFAAQSGIWTPVLFVLGAIAVAAGWREYRNLPLADRVLTWAATMPLAVFALASLRAHGEGNWPDLAYFPMSVLTAKFVTRPGPAGRPGARIAWAGCAVALAIAAVAQFPEVLKAAHARTPVSLRNLFGWRELGQEIGRVRAASGVDVVFTDRMQDAGELSFYLPGRPDVWFYRPAGRRPSAFDYFEGAPDPRDAARVLFVGNKADEFCRMYGFKIASQGLWTYRHGRGTPDRTRSYWVLDRGRACATGNETSRNATPAPSPARRGRRSAETRTPP